MNHVLQKTAICGITTLLALTVSAEPAEPRRGDHPAVIVKRLAADAPYDYASKFYPHPAWLYLSAEPPRPMMEHPAVLVFRREQQARALAAAAAAAPFTDR